MENSFKQIIDSANSVVILLPTRPYFDQVAAALGLYLSLGNRKEVAISCPSEMVVEFHRLVGVDKITKELGNKNLTLKFAGYNAADIEKVSYDIENNEFKLTVVPKTGLVAPTKEQIALSYAGVSADTVILVGGGNSSHFPFLEKELSGVRTIHLGTKALVTGGGENILSFARPASSTAEVVAAYLVESGFDLSADIATNLIAGIEEASKGLKSNEVTADTFALMANLMKAGGRRVLNERIVRESFPVGSIPGEKPVAPEPVVAKPVLTQTQPEESLEEEPQAVSQPTPQDWLEPKIYKGTSVS